MLPVLSHVAPIPFSLDLTKLLGYAGPSHAFWVLFHCYRSISHTGHCSFDPQARPQVAAVVCVPAVAGIPFVAGVPLVPDVLTVAGLLAIAGIPGVVDVDVDVPAVAGVAVASAHALAGVLALASAPADPGILYYMYIMSRIRLSDYQTMATGL
jgi:hypothetical protein